MSQEANQQPTSSQSKLANINSWLLRGLLFLWITGVVGIIINVGSTWLTTKGFDVQGTPLGWLLQHLPLTLACGGGLLLLTVISYTFNLRSTPTSPKTVGLFPTQKERTVLLNVLKKEYQRQLTESLHGVTLMHLKLQERTDVVASPAQLISWRLNDPDRTALPTSTSIIEVYDDAATGLLILGAPGSGKSTLLRELANELLTRAEQDATQPIPLLLNLSSWARNKQALEIWLVEQLQLVYSLPRQLSLAWMKEQQLLFLLDGLDEVVASARTECIEAINTFHDEHFMQPLVVCSRSKDYLAQEAQLKLPLAVETQPLTPPQVNEYLKHLGREMAAVRAVLQSNSTLRDLITTPLMLSIVMLSYRGKLAKDLPQIGTVQERQRLIFEHYVRHMLNQPTRVWSYSAGDTRRWLVYLAKQMNQHHLTEFYVEGLQRSWLPQKAVTALFPWITGLLAGVLVGLLVGVLVGLLAGVLVGLLIGLLIGPLGPLVGLNNNKIEPAEKISWLWKEFLRPFLGLPNGLLAVLVFGLFGWLPAWSFGGLFGGLLACLFTGLFGGLLAGLKTAQIDEHMRLEPNQGIQISGKNAFRIGLLVGLIFGLIFESLFWLLDRPFIEPLFWLRIGPLSWLLFGLIYWLLFGGAAYLTHYNLRFFLWRSHVMPWRYVRFLNEACDRILLQRVGGGYRFIHPLFQEYFASLNSNS